MEWTEAGTGGGEWREGELVWVKWNDLLEKRSEAGPDGEILAFSKSSPFRGEARVFKDPVDKDIYDAMEVPGTRVHEHALRRRLILSLRLAVRSQEGL